MVPPPDQLPQFDRDRVMALAQTVAAVHGAEIVDVEFRSEQGGWVLRVFVERKGSSDAMLSTKDAALALDNCAKISRDLSPALDVDDIIPHRYHLEVSSPGVERVLRNARDFERFSGQKAKVKLARPVRGQKVLVGTIALAAPDRVRMVTDGDREEEFELADVVHAQLVFEFGRSAPGKVSKGKSKSSSPHSGPRKGQSPAREKGRRKKKAAVSKQSRRTNASGASH